MRGLLNILACIAVIIPGMTQAAPLTTKTRVEAAIASAKAAMLVNPQQTIDQVKRAQPLANRLVDQRSRKRAVATLMWLESEALTRLDRFDEAAPLAEQAMTLARGSAAGTRLEADLLLTRGSIYGSQTHVGAALADFQGAHRVYYGLGDHRGESISLIFLAALFSDEKDYAAALRYITEAIETYHADLGMAQSLYNNRGVVYQDQGRYAEADVDYRNALAAAKSLKSVSLQLQILRNIARNMLLAGKLVKADAAIAAARALPNLSPDDVAQISAVAAQAQLQHGRPDAAGTLIDQAFAGVDLATTDMSFWPAHATAVATYRALHRPELALAHLEALKRLDDAATKLATQTSTALMAARFDSANQEAKIARLKLEDSLQRARTERMMALGATGSTAFIIVLLLFGIAALRRSRDQVRAANADLAITNGALGKALAAKTEFLATTSHEIRTPLNGILGMTQVMLADATLPDATRERIDVVHGAGLTMRALVDDILDVAKMETGHLALDQAPFDLRACLTEAALLWSEQAREKGLDFIVDLERCPRRVEGDAARVRQIAFNLLSNALKFTATGSVTLIGDSRDGAVCISVRDTGIGIAADKLATVFEAFRQADTSTTRRFGGTGLGLSICRNLARAMDGEVTLTSEAGRGSTFTATLPLPILADVAPEPCAASGGPTLLVIDRNPITRAMFRVLFADRIAVVTFASSAADAAACLAGGAVTQMLIDDATVRGSGDPHRFLADLVAIAGHAETTLLWPISADRELGELLALGVTRVVGKPVTGGALADALFPPVLPDHDTPLVSEAA